MAEQKLEARLSVTGADQAAASARKALDPWTQGATKAKAAFKEFRSELGSAVQGTLNDLGRVVTAGTAINFHGAVEGVKSFEAAASNMATATGKSFEQTRKELNALSERLGESPKEIASYVSAIGKSTYDFEGAKRNLEAFRSFAKETGRDISEQSGLAQAFKGLGIDDAEKGLRQLRAAADNLKTSGGVTALSDQVAGLSSVFARASNSGEQLIALTAKLGQGFRTPQQAAEAQRSVVGRIAGDVRGYERHFQSMGLLKRGESLVNERGEIDIAKAIQLRQRELRGMKDRAHARRIAAQEFGELGGAAILNNDLSGLATGEKASNAAATYAATPGGQAAANAAGRERAENVALGNGSILGDARQWFDKAVQDPFARLGLGTGGGIVAKMGGDYLKRRIMGGVAREAAKRGGQQLAESALEGGAGTAALPVAVLAASALATGKTLTELGAASKVKQGYALQSINADDAAAAAASAQGAEAAAAGNRSEGVQGAAVSELVRLSEHAATPVEGATKAYQGALKLRLDEKSADAIAKAVYEAMSKAPVAVTVMDATKAGVEVHPQPGGHQ